MTVPAQTASQVSTANGVTTVFPYNFRILDQDDLLVQVDGVTMTVGADYTVSGVGVAGGGNVTFAVAPADQATVLRKRNMAYRREEDYQSGGDLISTEVNRDYDAAVMMIQQLDEVQARSLRVPPAYVGLVNTELPPPEEGSLLGWQANAVVNLGNTFGPADLTLRTDIASDASGKGADLVAFKSPLAGGVARTLHDRAQDWVSIFDFCTTAQIADIRTRARTLDVSDAFTAAIASGKKIYCPAGDYLIGKTVGTNTREIGYHLEGDGPKFTKFVINGSGVAGVSAGFLASGTTTIVKGIMFTPIGAKPTRALHIDNTSIYSFGDLIEDCWFYAESAALNFVAGLEMTNNWYWAVRNCVFQNGIIGTDYNGNNVTLRSTVAGVIDSCHMLAADRAVNCSPDVVAGHMNEGLSITNCNIAVVGTVAFCPPNTVAHPSETYSLTISHNVLDPIRDWVVKGKVDSLRVVNNHIGTVSSTSAFIDLDAESYSPVIGQNRVIGQSPSSATAIIVRDQGAIIDGNQIQGFNIAADLTSADRAIVTNNTFSLTAAAPVIMGTNGIYEGNQEVSCGAAPTLGAAARCGVWTPTISATTNAAATLAYEGQWQRVKQGAFDVVTVSGKFDFDPTAGAAASALELSLPVASDFSAQQQCCGTAAIEAGENIVASIRANVGNNTARVSWVSGADLTNRPWYFTFTYRVL